MTGWLWSVGANDDSKVSGLWNLMVDIAVNSGREGWRKQVLRTRKSLVLNR